MFLLVLAGVLNTLRDLKSCEILSINRLKLVRVLPTCEGQKQTLVSRGAEASVVVKKLGFTNVVLIANQPGAGVRKVRKSEKPKSQRYQNTTALQARRTTLFKERKEVNSKRKNKKIHPTDLKTNTLLDTMQKTI